MPSRKVQTVGDLIKELNQFNPRLSVYIDINLVAKPLRVIWTAVDPSLGRPETVLITEDK